MVDNCKNRVLKQRLARRRVQNRRIFWTNLGTTHTRNLAFFPKSARVLLFLQLYFDCRAQMKKIILADQKLNQLVDEITSSLMHQYTFENGAISGEGITAFCQHAQVNQFILFRIYQDWNAQISQMVHPYFDYSATEVKEGLKRFLNLLSGHILVREGDFEPLVRSAVYNSLKLILNAEEAIGKFFFLNTEAIHIEVYRKHAPYFTDFDFVIQAILKYHEKNQLGQVEKNVFFEKFERVVELWEGKEGKSISEYQRGLFRNLTGRELEDVIGREPVAPEVRSVEEQAPAVEEQSEERKRPVIKVQPTVRVEEPKPQPPVEEERQVTREVKTNLPPWVEQPTAPPVSREEPQESKFSSNSKPPRTDLPPWVKEEVNERSKPETLASNLVTPKEEKPATDKPRSLLDAFSREGKPSIVDRSIEKKEGNPQTPPVEVRVNPPREEEKPPVIEAKPVEQPVQRPSLISQERGNDDGQKEQPRTLADKFRQQSPGHDAEDSGKSLKPDQIPVHKQFQFVQKVFGGSSVKFKVVLDKINKTETLDEANEVLDKYVFNDQNVNRNDKVSKEFEAMVRARFEA
jgi:hypothetical protein